MPALFNVTFNLGPAAPLGIVTGAIIDLETLGVTALRIAELQAEAEARRYLTDMVTNEGPSALINLVRERELPGGVNRLDLEYLEMLLHDLEYWPRGPRRYRWAALAAALFPAPGLGLLELPGLGPVVRRLLAMETAERTPSRGFRVQSLRYQNPVSAEIISEFGVAAVGLAFLLAVVRDWAPRRQRERARANAEERIQVAHAQDAEDRVSKKIELRRLMVERIARGELDISSEALADLLVDDIVGAADRLADRELTYEQRELPKA